MRDLFPPRSYAPSMKFQRAMGWLDAVSDSLPVDVPGETPMRGIVEMATHIARQALAEADAMAVENERMREWFTDRLDRRLEAQDA